jgi:hypothetical protein
MAEDAKRLKTGEEAQPLPSKQRNSFQDAHHEFLGVRQELNFPERLVEFRFRRSSL